MKSPEYVACVTKIYRKYIDIVYSGEKYKINQEDVKELAQVFNRGNFSDGYFTKRLGKDFISRQRSKNWGTYLGKVVKYNPKNGMVEIKLNNDIDMGDIIEILGEELTSGTVTYIGIGNQQIKRANVNQKVIIGDFYGDIKVGQDIYKISSSEQNKRLKETFSGKYHKKIPISAQIDIEIGNKVKLILKEGNNIIKVESDFIVEKAMNRETTREDVLNSLTKLGDTPFVIENYEINVDKSSYVPLKILNELRRSAALLLENKKKEVIVDKTFNVINPVNSNRLRKDKKIDRL